MTTQVYWHSRKKLYSVRRGGKVVEHTPEITLRDVRFVVSQSGLRRYRETGVRNVHAWANGTELTEEGIRSGKTCYEVRYVRGLGFDSGWAKYAHFTVNKDRPVVIACGL